VPSAGAKPSTHEFVGDYTIQTITTNKIRKEKETQIVHNADLLPLSST
jgi:hypothetical protein